MSVLPGQRRPLLFVLSSPSGAGKSTLSRMLLEHERGIVMSVSATTRVARSGEIDGEHYHFLSNEKFSNLMKQGAFLECAEVHGNYYGTLKSEVHAAFSLGKDVLFDIDWQGTQQIRQSMSDRLVTIFILPPSLSELENRLRSRAQDSEEVVLKRMAKAKEEILHWAEYDYVFINDNLDECFSAVSEVLKTERLRPFRYPDLKQTIRRLTAETP